MLLAPFRFPPPHQSVYICHQPIRARPAVSVGPNQVLKPSHKILLFLCLLMVHTLKQESACDNVALNCQTTPRLGPVTVRRINQTHNRVDYDNVKAGHTLCHLRAIWTRQPPLHPLHPLRISFNTDFTGDFFHRRAAPTLDCYFLITN